MTLHPENIGPIPEETIRVARAAFPKGNNYMRMRDELGTLYTDDDFADLFPRCGQLALAPWRLALITIMQFAEGLSDRQAADAVRARIDWKYALGLELTDPGFDFSVLSEFRARLQAGEAEERILERMLDHFRAGNLLKARGRQRTDSTAIVAAIRVLNRLELVGETMRQLLNVLAHVAPDWVKQVMLPTWSERYIRPFSDYHLPTDHAERDALAETIGADGIYLLTLVYSSAAPPGVRDLPEVEIMRQIWLQSFYQEEGRVRWRIRDNLPPGGKMIVSPYDPTARASYKRDMLWYGFKVHLTETCDEDLPHFITHVATTAATEPDVNLVGPIQADLAARDLLPSEHIVDAGYTASTLLVHSRHLGVDLLGPVRPDISWQAKAGEGFDISGFDIDWETRQVTCPQGHVGAGWYENIGFRGKPRVQVNFRAADCLPCPARDQCTRSASRARQITFPPQQEHLALQAARARQQTEDFKERYAARAGIEGTISQAAYALGMRRTRYRGLPKVHLQHVFTASAINLSRVLAWLEEKPPAKTRQSVFAKLVAAA